MAQMLAKRSTCLDKQVGCIITNDKNEIIASGYNGAPRGEQHCTDLGYCKAEFYSSKDFCPSAHAEQLTLTQKTIVHQLTQNKMLYYSVEFRNRYIQSI
jgi:dCMP deaminase